MSKTSKFILFSIIILIIIIIAILIFYLYEKTQLDEEINENVTSDNNNITSDSDDNNITSNNEIEDFDYQEILNQYGTNNNEEVNFEIPHGESYNYKMPTDEQMVKQYLYIYKQNIYYHIEDAFNQLDDEYKASFGSLDNYKNYVQENKEFINNLVTANYSNLVVSQDEPNFINIYQFNDDNGRTYIIKETAIMKFTINIK